MSAPLVFPLRFHRLVPSGLHACQLRRSSSQHQCNVAQSKRKLILAEYELLKHQQPEKVPSQLSPSHLVYLSSLQKSKRIKRVSWLDISYQAREQAFQRLRNVETFDGTGNLLVPLVGSEIERHLRKQQISMMPFVPNIIFDISFDEHMSTLECKNLAEQLIHIFNLNKFGIGPSINWSNTDLFNLHVTNLRASELTKGFLDSLFGPDLRQYYPNVFFHEEPFIDVFPDKSRLIFLSPHAEETMSEYDHDALYIIGGIVDRREIVELTPEKCARLGIRSQRLPIGSILRAQVQSLYGVYKFLYEFKYNAASFGMESVSKLVKKHLPLKLRRNPTH